MGYQFLCSLEHMLMDHRHPFTPSSQLNKREKRWQIVLLITLSQEKFITIANIQHGLHMIIIYKN